jgi:prepilin-type N-terminal cleavage/methylation domain-containing protein
MTKDMRKGFTLVELLVVMAMLMLLIGSISSSVISAQRRAKIAVATTGVLEISNAILAYENYGELKSMEEQPSTESNLGFILGKETEDGRKVPVLYNAAIKGGKILDPWGNPYIITITEGTISGKRTRNMNTAVFFPNFYRPKEL